MMLSLAKPRPTAPPRLIRTFMSTMTQPAPQDDECRFMLILGKPGGGKGTISGKILKVCLMQSIGISREMYILSILLNRSIDFIGLSTITSYLYRRFVENACPSTNGIR
jgi:hypothetical protein